MVYVTDDICGVMSCGIVSTGDVFGDYILC